MADAEAGGVGRSITFKSFGVIMSELKQQQDFDESIDLPRSILASRVSQPGTAAERIQAHHAKYMRSNRVVRQAKWKIVRNVLILSLVAMLAFTAFNSIQYIQHAFHFSNDVRYYGYSSLYAVLLAVCLFLTPIIIEHLGYKWAIVVSLVPFGMYMIANMHMGWVSIMPTSVLLGAGIAVFWPAASAYITEASTQYADWAGLDAEVAINCFFGLFFMIFHTANIWGSLISSHLLTELTFLFHLQSQNATTCGVFNCYTYENQSANFQWPVIWRVYALCGVYASLCCLALGLAIAFISDDLRHKGSSLENYDSLDREEATLRVLTSSRLSSVPGEDECRANGELLLSTIKQHGDLYQVLLVPLTLYIGMQQGFFWQDFTKSYIECELGLQSVGFALISSATAAAVFSLVFGEVVRCTGRSPIIAYGGVVHCSLMVALFLWPRAEYPWTYYLVSALWGSADASLQTIINGFYGTLFMANKDAAFASYRFWESVGLILAFTSARYLCVYIKIYILLGTLILGLAGYFIVERKVHNEKEDESYS